MVREERPSMIFCDCGHHAIQLEYDEEVDLTFMSFWEYGHKAYKRSWKDHLKMIWKIIKTGTPYSDNVVLNQQERRVLIDALEKHTPFKLNQVIIETANTACIEEEK